MFITHVSCSNSGIAQTTSFYPNPWIQEINLRDHFSDIPNRSFYLDRQGILFLGKDNGLTIISSDRSIHLYLKGPVYVYGTDTDSLYYACENDLGMLEKKQNGNYILHSFKDHLLWEKRRFTPSHIICHNGDAFVATNNGIYRITTDGAEHILSPGTDFRFQHQGTRLLIYSEEEAMMWDGNRFIEYPSFRYPEMKDFEILSVLPGGDFLGRSASFKMEIRNKKGQIISLPGIDESVPDDDLVQVSIFNNHEIWILGLHSLHMLRYPSPLNILDLAPALKGRIISVLVAEHQILLGTNEGIYLTGQATFDEQIWNIRPITGTEGHSYHLLEHNGNGFFAAGSGQLYYLDSITALTLAQGDFTGLAALTDEQAFASDQNGFHSYNKTGNNWETRTIDTSLVFAHSLMAFNDQVFMICENQPFRYDPGDGQVHRLSFQEPDFLYKFLALKGRIYLLTNSNAYTFKDNEAAFSPVNDPFLRDILLDSEDIIYDGDQGYWFVKSDENYQTRVVHAWSEEASEEKDHSAYPILQNLGEITGINLNGQVLYIAGQDRLAIFNMSGLSTPDQAHSINIRQIKPPSRGTAPVFRLEGLEFQRRPLPEFRYNVDPGAGNWTAWSQDREISFDRLRAGNYSMTVQGRDLYGNISEGQGIRFTVRPPHYLSWYAFLIYGLLTLIVLFLLRKLRMLSYQKAETRVSQRMQRMLDKVTSEKEKSDRLVADILPAKTAEQLKSEGRSKWDKYERATVLFSDIQGFTKIAEEMNPEALIDELDQFFFHFDSVVEKYNIEKIKTIGDAYMAAGGIPRKNSTNPVEVVLAALEMQTYMQQLKAQKTNIWDLRIGIHTGPVIAGVVGHKKVSYDIWGDTVNTASRMESSGEPGKVNISGITYGMVKEYFLCEYRGKLPVKYKGNIDMYFVTGLRPELSVDLKGIPNKRFYTKLQIMRLVDLEEKVFDSLLSELPSYLHFHGIEYARKVYNQSFLLSRAEEIEEDERLLVRTAALFLYTGLSESYTNFENRSAIIARDILPQFSYSEKQVYRICNLILATKQPFQPANQLEMIMIDAKMEFIGKPDFSDQINLLFQEFREAGVNINGQQFKKQQLELLYSFDFFTTTASRLREIGKEDQISSLENERWI